MGAPKDAGAGVGSVGGDGEHATGHAVDPCWCRAECIGRKDEQAVYPVEAVLMQFIAFAPNVSVRAIGSIPPNGSAMDMIDADARRCDAERLDDVGVGCDGAESAHVIAV